MESLTQVHDLSHPFTARLILPMFLVAGGAGALADVPPLWEMPGSEPGDIDLPA